MALPQYLLRNRTVDRFKIFLRFKDGINSSINHDISEILNIFITPLYLYAINCIEGKTEKKYSELSTYHKIIVFPKKIRNKIVFYREKKIRQKALSYCSNINKSNVIFYPVEPTHLKQMIPVSSYLEKHEYVYVTDRINIWRDLKKQGIDCRYLDLSKKVYNEQEQNFDALNIVLEQIWKNINPAFVSNEWISFVRNLIVNRYPVLESACTELLNKVNPKKVVVGYDTTPEGRLMTVLCKKRGIESVCIQHGSIAGEPLDGEHIVDNYLLYGEKVKEYLTKIGNKPETLRVFGAPYLDNISSSSTERINLLRKLNLDPNKKTVLVALSGPGHCTTFKHFNMIISSIVESSNRLPKYNFVFKLHRKDKSENYTNAISQANSSIPVVEATDKKKPTDIFSWLGAVDLLITGSSTVALEAMLLQVPVLTVDYFNEYQGVDFIEEGCTFHVSNKKHLDRTVAEILNQNESDNFTLIQSKAKEYISRYFYKDDIPASKRIADWLLVK